MALLKSVVDYRLSAQKICTAHRLLTITLLGFRY